MRQTVAVGVIKATTPKTLEGKQTKAADKALKKKWNAEQGQQEFTLLFTPHGNQITQIENSTLQPWFAKFWKFQFSGTFLKLAFTSIERNFAGYILTCFLVAPSLIRTLLFRLFDQIGCLGSIFVQ